MHDVATPEGLSLHPEWIAAVDETRLLDAIDGAPWQGELKRRVQHYGWRYDYKARAVRAQDYLGPLPAWSLALARRLADPELMGREPDQLIVNEYTPGQGISQHVDRPVFGPVIVSLSLGSACVMKFTRGGARGSAVDARELVLPRRSLLVLRGPARSDWRHAIPARQGDPIDGRRVPRARRVSLTFRTVPTPTR
ncbi:MAG: alpha-ketoglutarate-dependent dioxygenase AlkB [Myxococcales bacterium]|nr:alpha-ketoglutarate-dependent dioxygenase AlkB [Myxococcales bacterium]MCB9753952.1 alpha-ketoglutarate-dependent dioxygenase AlkB [Myxococcales bacterium]